MKVKSESEVAQLRPHGLQPTGASIHAIFQARVLEWVAIALSGEHSICASKIKASSKVIFQKRITL